MLKKFKINFKSWLTWLNIVAIICVMATIGTAYYSADDFITKAFSFISFWWVFLILFYISENTNELKVEELTEKIKKKNKDWANLTGSIYKFWHIDGRITEKELDKIVNQIEKADAKEIERISSGEKEIITPKTEGGKETSNNEAGFSETIKLMRPEKSPDAFYTNEKIIATFCPDEIFPNTRKDWPIYAGQDDVPLYMDHRENYLKIKNGKCLSNTFEAYLPEILNSGKVMILSKEENKFIYEIKRKKRGFSAGELAGRCGYEYYLPNNTLFFKTTNWVS